MLVHITIEVRMLPKIGGAMKILMFMVDVVLKLMKGM